MRSVLTAMSRQHPDITSAPIAHDRSPRLQRPGGENEAEMNMYRVLGDQIGTLEARALARQLVEWHDAMVKHLRVTAQRGRECPEGCPHEEARGLWSAAMDVFGDYAGELTFLRTHDSLRTRAASAAVIEVHP